MVKVLIEQGPQGCIRCKFIEVGKVHEEEVLICSKPGVGGTVMGLAWRWSRVFIREEKKKMFG